MGRDASYAAYLQLPALLRLQSRRSSVDDEMMFIVVHQVSELWLRLALFEVDVARRALTRGAIAEATLPLERVAQVLRRMTDVWPVLDSMSAEAFAAFRPLLGDGSGLESLQYRMLDVALGADPQAAAAVFPDGSRERQVLRSAAASPSVDELVSRVVRQRVPHAAYETGDAWQQVWSAPGEQAELQALGERLVAIERAAYAWRRGHVATARRLIGSRPGTAGTAGAAYLARALPRRYFPALARIVGELDADGGPGAKRG